MSDFPADGMALAKYAARRLCRTMPRRMDRDDILSGCLEGVLRAHRTYDPERGMSWKNWAYVCAKRVAIDLSRKLLGRYRVGRANTSTVTCANLKHLAAPPEPCPFQAEDDRVCLERRIRPLPVRHRAAMRYLFLDGLEQQHAAHAMGVHPSRVSQLVAQARRMLTEGGPA